MPIKNLFIIACISKDGGIGLDNHLLWHIKEDMQFFKNLTQGNTVIMGKRTYESIGKPLKDRTNVVLSHNKMENGVDTYSSHHDLDSYLKTTKSNKIVIGGVSLYRMYLDEAEKLYLTEVDAVKPADTYFPEFDKSQFRRKVLSSGEHEGIAYEIVEYTRRAR